MYKIWQRHIEFLQCLGYNAMLADVTFFYGYRVCTCCEGECRMTHIMRDEKIKTLLQACKTVGPLKIGFLLVPNFSMIAFSSAIEALRIANRMSNRMLFEWVLASPTGKAVQASNGVVVTVDSSSEALENCRIVFACSGIDIKQQATQEILHSIRKLERGGVVIGAICTGTYLMAASGLLDDKRCTIHWENITALTEEFPCLDITNELFEIDGSRITCAGGTAALDMMLYLIAQTHGHHLATQISEQCMHDRIREPSEHQRMALRLRLDISHPKLLAVIKYMEEQLDEPYSQAELAEKAHLSTRQLERLFQKYLHTTPTRYYLKLRLQRARDLLRQTSLSILSVALSCGFVSASHFSKCYRDIYGRPPRHERAETVIQ